MWRMRRQGAQVYYRPGLAGALDYYRPGLTGPLAYYRPGLAGCTGDGEGEASCRQQQQHEEGYRRRPWLRCCCYRCARL